MAGTDSQSSLPIKTVTNGDVVAFLADGTTPSQLLGIDASGRITMKLDDGSGNVVTSQVNGAQRALDVGVNVAGVQIDPRLSGQYNSTLPTLTTGNFTAPQTDSSGRLLIVQPTAALLNATVVQGTPGATAWLTTDAANGSVTGGTAGSKSELAGGQFNTSLPVLTTGQQAAMQLDSSGRLIIRPLTDSDRVSADMCIASASVSLTNPVPVYLTNSAPGTNVYYYNATASIAVAGTDSTSKYIITASKTLSLKVLVLSSTDHMRFDVIISPDGTTLNTKITGFTSVANPTVVIPFDSFALQDTGTGSFIQVTWTNLDSKLASAYTTIEGTEA